MRHVANSFDDATHRKLQSGLILNYPHPRGSFVGGFILIRKRNSWQKWNISTQIQLLWNIVRFWYCICQDFPSNWLICPWSFWCFESITVVIFAYPLPFLKYRHLPRRICRWFWVCSMWGCSVQTSQVCICLKVSDVSKFATPQNPPYCVLWRFAALLCIGRSLCFISRITH